MDQDVQVLSQHDAEGGVRTYQLSPRPDVTWWRTFGKVAGRRLPQLGGPSAGAVETGHGGDELRISGITAETSVATDRWLSSVVTETNREFRKP
jgi:hypothetical protein